ncbi:MAG: cation:dicarboxylase symporter family transporter [Halieaceae bacterium]|jgi:Na+/H+-dicarboxylate symporter/ABC-type amino acid transport substrate-binding protein|nr:cation:dicarboxylase symporter family transporter [Halieaceae bacterium]
MSFTLQICLGLLLGILTGLFLGDLALPFSTAGEIYIGLLQMTVLPYIVVSLIANLGRISWAESRGLLTAAISALGVLLLLGVVTLITVPLAFPDREAASFFSSSLVETPPPTNLVELYIPSNPFGSMANNVVPATVLFSILLGIGLSGVSGKEGLLRALDALADGLNRINKLVIKLTPAGAFAIAAGVAGTILVDDISKLQAYLLTYTVVCLILTFLVLPLLVTALTPFRYKDLLTIPRDTLVTIFATGKIIVVLPQLIDNLHELFDRYGLEDEQNDRGISILLPLAYPFPNLGTYAILMFVPFSAWYLGSGLELPEQLMFQASALMSSFVAPIIGIPFLLDLLEIPADMMELFVMSTVYTDRIRVVLGAMHLITLTIIAVAISRGAFRVDWMRLLRAGVVSLAAVVLSLLALRGYLGYAMAESYRGDQELIEITFLEPPVETRVWHDELPPAEAAVGALGRLQIIERRGTLRVGYMDDSLPFAYRNRAAELMGFDIEMAHRLAGDLGVTLELVRIDFEAAPELLADGRIDIVMSGVGITPGRLRQFRFGASPMDLTLSLLVEDHRRREFKSHEAVQRARGLKFGIVQRDPAFLREAQKQFPNVELVPVDSPRRFLRGNRPELDAVIYSAEGGAAWTLIYPGYAVVVPHPLEYKVPLGYPLPMEDEAWGLFVSEWTRLRQKNGTVQALFDHWISGDGADVEKQRWSVVRDVLHWVD